MAAVLELGDRNHMATTSACQCREGVAEHTGAPGEVVRRRCSNQVVVNVEAAVAEAVVGRLLEVSDALPGPGSLYC
jgi:hypothetical protein